MDSDHVIVVETLRGQIVECRYRGSAAVVDSKGKIVSSIGNAQVVTTIRSTAKPFQTIPLLEHSQNHWLNLTPKEIAVMAGSHNGEDAHIGVIQELMNKGGISEKDLRCGIHPPFLFSISEKTMLKERRPISPLQHNCSGNHAGMLLLAKLMNAPMASYQSPEHIIQKIITSTICQLFDISQAELMLAIDGCGIPTYACRLDQLALAYVRLATANETDEHGKALAIIRDAMMNYPFLVAGTDRLETDLMLTCPVIAKSGAQGVYAIGLPDSKLGIAVKIESGSSEAAECLMVEILNMLGILKKESLTKLNKYRMRPILSSDNIEVGTYKPVITLT